MLVAGDTKPARAAPILGSVPEIDRVTVSVIVDNYQFVVTPNVKVGNVDIRPYGWGLSDKPPSKTLISEFGSRCMSGRNPERNRDAYSWTSASRTRLWSTTLICWGSILASSTHSF